MMVRTKMSRVRWEKYRVLYKCKEGMTWFVKHFSASSGGIHIKDGQGMDPSLP